MVFPKRNYKYVEIKCQLDAKDVFYCRSYFLLNMFQAPLCPSSGARGYYTVGCCLSYLVLWFSSCRYGVELRVVCPVCGLLLMGIMVPETCWASNKICNKNHLLHLVGILFPHINEDARSKPHQISYSKIYAEFKITFTLRSCLGHKTLVYCIRYKTDQSQLLSAFSKRWIFNGVNGKHICGFV